MNYNELKILWKEQGFRPDKRLGQNFLVDKNVRNNILDAMFRDMKSTVVEIGAGFGVMSFEIAERCDRLYAVEKDRRICSIMEPIFRRKENLTLVQGDILDLDICDFARNSGKITVFGNIPYYITTPVIEKMIEQRQCVENIYIVIQEEFAERIASSPGSKQFGSISCYVQFYMEVKKLLRIKRNSFYPRPKVDSCLLKMSVFSKPPVRVKEAELMFRIIRRSFSQRRKKIINPLSHDAFLSIERDGWQEIFDKCGIDPSLRAEDLSLTDFAKLSDAVSELRGRV